MRLGDARHRETASVRRLGVTGPMHTTLAGVVDGPATASQLSTVDADVNVMASARAAAPTRAGDGDAATVR